VASFITMLTKHALKGRAVLGTAVAPLVLLPAYRIFFVISLATGASSPSSFFSGTSSVPYGDPHFPAPGKCGLQLTDRAPQSVARYTRPRE